MRAILRRLAPLLPVVLFSAALWLLHQELEPSHYHQAVAYVRELPNLSLVLAAALTAFGYVALTGYDLLGCRYAGSDLPYRQVGLAAFTAYAFSNTLGQALLTGAPLRFRLYGTWGVSAEQVTKIVGFGFLTFWVGFVSLVGAVFAFAPGSLPPALDPLGALDLLASLVPGGAGERAFGVGLLALVALYLAACAFYRRPLVIRSWQISLPTARLALGQVAVSAVDWVLAAAVLYVLLPAAVAPPFAGFLVAFLLAQMAGFTSQVPGGLGVFETVLVLSLTGHHAVSAATGDGRDLVATGGLLGALLLYRAIYYLGPLVLAALTLAGVELHRERVRLQRAVGAAARLATLVVPQALALTTFVGGALLLVTGATPAHASRLSWLNDLLPLPVIEASHFLASLSGALLMVLARGLQRRLDVAYHATVALLAGGIAFSLLRGLDWATAIALGFMLIALAPLHQAFDRKASLLEARLSPGWVTGIVLVLAATLWLTLFVYRHVEYSQELWWSFALHGDAPRALRALVAASAALLVLAAIRGLRPAPPDPDPPTPEQLDRTEEVAAGASRTDGLLALLGDKRLLFSPERDAYLMYAVESRSWIALGDPVESVASVALAGASGAPGVEGTLRPAGAGRAARELAWRFRELVERHDGWPVFYQVAEENLHLYVDMGLSLLKLGEEGQVPLDGFSLDGHRRKDLRNALRRTEEREECRFEIVPREGVAELLPVLRQVSDAWLGGKSAAEKGFSLGRFDSAYLERFPIALVRRGDEVIAFANVLAAGEELSLDLMRFGSEAPPGVMTYLFTRVMLWGSAAGYRRFDLGMTPFAGLEGRTGAPLWNRVAGLVYRHGEHFYNFQGLRHYKEKFDPVWEPRYLAFPGSLALPQILVHLAALISGGVTAVFRR